MKYFLQFCLSIVLQGKKRDNNKYKDQLGLEGCIRAVTRRFEHHKQTALVFQKTIISQKINSFLQNFCVYENVHPTTRRSKPPNSQSPKNVLLHSSQNFIAGLPEIGQATRF